MHSSANIIYSNNVLLTLFYSISQKAIDDDEDDGNDDDEVEIVRASDHRDGDVICGAGNRRNGPYRAMIERLAPGKCT